MIIWLENLYSHFAAVSKCDCYYLLYVQYMNIVPLQPNILLKISCLSTVIVSLLILKILCLLINKSFDNNSWKFGRCEQILFMSRYYLLALKEFQIASWKNNKNIVTSEWLFYKYLIGVSRFLWIKTNCIVGSICFLANFLLDFANWILEVIDRKQ